MTLEGKVRHQGGGEGTSLMDVPKDEKTNLFNVDQAIGQLNQRELKLDGAIGDFAEPL